MRAPQTDNTTPAQAPSTTTKATYTTTNLLTGQSALSKPVTTEQIQPGPSTISPGSSAAPTQPTQTIPTMSYNIASSISLQTMRPFGPTGTQGLRKL